MKILSTFDAGLKKKVLAEFHEKRIPSDVLLIERSQLFLRLHIRIPLISYFLGAGILLRVLRSFGQAFFFYLGLPIALAGLFVILRPVTKRLLDFALDFVVVSPHGVYSYNQTGILARSNRFLNHSNIRSISVNRKWIFYSIFNNGDIFILSEGGSENDLGDVTLNFVPHPDRVKKKMETILSKEFHGD